MKKPTSLDSSVENLNPAQDQVTVEKTARRDAIRRIGKYSAYAVPALLALSAKATPPASAA